MSVIKSKAKFISQQHIGYSVDVDFVPLNAKLDYTLSNITQMQVADLRLALQICDINNIGADSHIKIDSLDKTTYQKDLYPQVNYLLDNQNNILDLRAKAMEMFLLFVDKKSGAQDINDIFKQIKDILNSYNLKQENIFNTLKDCNFDNTAQIFTEANQKLKELRIALDRSAKQAKQDLQNRFNKDIIILSAKIIGTTHLPLISLVLINNPHSKLAKRLIPLLRGVPLGPVGITISLLFLLYDIYDFISKKYKENQKIHAVYEVYGAIISIYEKLDYCLASILNVSHFGAGNLITTQKNNIFTYHLYPNYAKFNSMLLYEISKDDILIVADKVFKAKFSLDNDKYGKQSYIETIFSKNNDDSNHIITNKTITQFSTFCTSHLLKLYDKNDNIINSSAFQHLQNLLLKFDSFLFIKSSSFSSIIASDMLIQSFAQSLQNNKMRSNKTALILTNCLRHRLPEYKMQQYIKDKCFNNDYTKKNILFLSAMFRIKKVDFITYIIHQIIELFKQYKIPIKEINKSLKSYQMNIETFKDKKICDMNEKEFCSLVYELCALFTKGKILEKKQAKNQVNKNVEIMNMLLDISYLLSYFNDYEIAKFKKYQKEISDEYEKQKHLLQDFFQKKFIEPNNTPNVFHNIKDLETLYVAMLDMYFNNNDSALDLALNININYLEIEQDLQNNSLQNYQQLAIDYMMPLIPLHKDILQILDKQLLFKFCRISIQYILDSNNETKNNFLLGYETILLSLTAINIDIEQNNHYDKSILKMFFDIGEMAIKNIAKDTITYQLSKIKDKVKQYTTKTYNLRLFNQSNTDIVKQITQDIAKELDQRTNSYVKELYNKIDSGISIKHIAQISVINTIMTYIANTILDKIFPTQIKDSNDMKQKIVALLFMINRHRNTPYATCKQGSEYLTFPIEITQTFISADLRAILLGGSALDSGFCVKTPSVAMFSENEINSIKTIKESIKNFINFNVDFDALDGKKRSVIKEAYAKLWFYLEMGENKQLEHYLRNEVCIKPKECNLANLTDGRFMQTKLKKAKELDNDIKNFESKGGTAKDGIKFNHDFLIQLKRIAEWNYEIYTQKTKSKKNDCGECQQIEQLCGNLIYDDDFIPTTIDIID
ncbi:hypothetical protein [Helicobacter sp. T3_23-1059]